MIELVDVRKTYDLGEHEVHALAGVTLTIEDGEFVAIIGASGSGKSTMMNILGCLDQPTSGSYVLDGMRVSDLSEDELALVRNQAIGFVFQNYNLLPRMPAVRQVELPLIYRGVRDRLPLAVEALRAVGLGDRLFHKPTEMSGGQQQRVAIARALITSPSLILADEPTGNLDSRTSLEIVALFQSLNRQRNISVVYVTHEQEIAEHASRIIQMRDGRIVADLRNASPRWAPDELRALGPAPSDEDAMEVAVAAPVTPVVDARAELGWKRPLGSTVVDGADSLMGVGLPADSGADKRMGAVQDEAASEGDEALPSPSLPRAPLPGGEGCEGSGFR